MKDSLDFLYSTSSLIPIGYNRLNNNINNNNNNNMNTTTEINNNIESNIDSQFSHIQKGNNQNTIICMNLPNNNIELTNPGYKPRQV